MRLQLRTFLCLVFLTLLVAISGIVVSISYYWSRSAMRELTEREFSLANESIADAIGHTLDEPARRYLDELTLSARRRMLPLDDFPKLGMILAERLRVEHDLAWLSYSDAKTGRFVGVWRRPDGAVVINISAPDVDNGRPHEQVVTPSGSLIALDTQLPAGYDPRTKPWFKRAMETKRVIWSEPYAFAEGNSGITASRAWRQEDNAAPEGVFTVDFFLRDIDKRLASLSVRVKGFSCILATDGKIISATQSEDQVQLAALLKKLIEDSPMFQYGLRGVSTQLQPVVKGDEVYLTALYMLETSTGFRCIVASMAPESIVYAKANSAGAGMVLISLAGLVIAFIAIWIVAYIISEPLHNLGLDFERIRQFELGHEGVAGLSFLSEIRQISEASVRMKTGLKSFKRFVSDEVVQKVAASDKELTLGAYPKDVTIFFSDIEGFTGYSEKVKPQVLVEETAVYFGILTGALKKQGANIDKFLGDGLLAFFSSTPARMNHQEASCLATLNAFKDLEHAQKLGVCARFRSRIGLHSGEVLVGVMGTEDRFTDTIIGDPVNAASRLEAVNKVYGTQIIASEQVYEKATVGFEWRHLDRVAVAGRKGKMELYELLGIEGDVSQSVLYARDIYERGLSSYFAQEFETAARYFEEAERERPGDKASILMLKRCRQMMNNTPSPTWDGVYAFQEK